MSAVAEVLCLAERSSTDFSSILRHAPVGLAFCQSPGNVIAFNAAFAEVLGLRPHEARRSLAELIPSQNGLDTQRFLTELFRGTRDSFQVECPSNCAESKSLRWTVWSVEGEKGISNCAVAMVEDLSSLAIAKQRLQQSERLETLGRLAGGVAHDFNNLLTGVLLYCDLLMAAIEPGHRARKYAEEIRNAGLQAAGLVRQLLSVARSNTSIPRPVSLNEVAEGMRNLLIRLIGERIELNLRLDPDLGLVKMDPAQAQQILLNLVLNARDALAHGGRIAVETRNWKVQILSPQIENSDAKASVPCALFAVEDNGHGMDESVRSHLFEPFFTTKPGKGTGIGLTTVHDIVTSNGGLIHVQSEPQRGTRISVLLPLIPNTVPQSVQETSFHPGQSGAVLPFQSEDSTS